MQVTRAHKIELDPNDEARAAIACACGVARYAYNHALALSSRYYSIFKKSVSAARLKKHWNKRKPSWVYDSPKDANQQPFAHLDRAFKSFFKKNGSYPRFKKKGNNGSFYVSNDQAKLSENAIRLPKIGVVRLKESPRFGGKIMSFTVSMAAGRYFVSVTYQLEIAEPSRVAGSVGADLGVKNLAVLSTGEHFSNPRNLAKSAKRLRRYQRSVARSKKGSHNRRRKVLRVARLHWHIANQRKDAAHKLTTSLITRFGRIAIEDLYVKGMVKNHNLAKAISDCGFAEIRRQLEYKALSAGTELVLVDRFYPSSKLCSNCNYKYSELRLKDRSWTCPSCGQTHDRDVNAAINLNNYIGRATSKLTPRDIGVHPEDYSSGVDSGGTRKKLTRKSVQFS